MNHARARIGAVGLLVAAAGAVTLGTALVPAHATSPVTTDRLAGTTRYDTAKQIAEYKNPGSSSFAFGSPSQGVLVSGDNFPDALAASFLAGAYKAPTLLTAHDTLRSEAVQAFKDLGITNVTIVGGPFAVDSSEDAQLKAQGITATRVAGTDRDDTAAKVAQAPGTVVGTYGSKGATALLAADNTAHYVDALAAGPLAWAGHFPLLLTPSNTLAPVAAQALNNLNVHHVIVLGGSQAVSDNVVQSLTNMGLTVERLEGPDRMGTAIAIANAEHDFLSFLFARVFLAVGNNFPDSLAGGPIAGLLKNPSLLTLTTNDLSDETRGFIRANDGTISHVTAFGGPNAISDPVLADAGQSSTCSTTTTTSGGGGLPLPIPGPVGQSVGGPGQPVAADATTTTSTTAAPTTTTSTSSTTTTIPTCNTTTTSTPSSTTSSTSTTAAGGSASTTSTTAGGSGVPGLP